MVERALDQIGRRSELAEQPHQDARSQNRFLHFLTALSNQPDRLFAQHMPGRKSAVAIML
jgi:hypothetical protein